MQINQSTSDHISGAISATDDIGPSTPRSPRRPSSPAALSAEAIGALEGRRPPMNVSSTDLLAPRMKLLEVPQRSLTDLPRHLQLAIADRAEISAIPLALTSKAMRESTSSMAAKAFLLKRLEESDDAEVIRDVLSQASHGMLDFDAEMRSEVLRSVANRIRWTEEDQQDLLLDEFLTSIGALEPGQRTDALTALARAGLERGPQGPSRVEKMLDAINRESLARRAGPLAALGESLAEGLTPPTEMEHWVDPEVDPEVEPSEIGSVDSTAPSSTTLLSFELEEELDLELDAEQHLELHPHLEPHLDLEPEPDLPPEVEPGPVPQAHAFAVYSLLQQSIVALGGRADAAKPLAALAESLRLLDPHDPRQCESFDFLAREVERLPANSQSSTLEGLAKLVPVLEQEPLRAFHQVAAAIERVGPEHAGAALEVLIVRSDALPPWLTSATLDRISGLVEQMPPEPRASMLANLVRDIEPQQDGESAHRAQLRALVLQAIERLPDEFRGIALAGRATLPLKDGQPPIDEQRFDEITRMVAQLPAEHRAAALAALASGVADLAEDKRRLRLDHLLKLSEQVPAHEQGKPLSKLIRNIENLPDVQTRDHLWKKAMRMTGQPSPEGRAECIAELANQIRSLSSPLHEAAFESLSRAAAALPQGHRRNPFSALAMAIRALPSEARQEAFDRTLGMMGEVPADHRAFVLATMSHTAPYLPPYLPEGPMPKGDLRAGPAGAFDAILPLIEGLSDTGRDHALGVLAVAQGDVVEKGRAVDLIFEAISRLPVERRGRLLTSLLDKIKWSSGDAMNRQLAQAISMLDELPADHLGEALGTLAARLPIELLDPEAREHVFPHLLGLAERVPRRDIELPLLALATLLRDVPEPKSKQMQQAFDRLIEMTQQHGNHLPIETMGALLGELAMQLQALPEREQITSAWKDIHSLLLSRELHPADSDGVLAGMMSAAPWLKHSMQVKAVHALLRVVENSKSVEKLVVALAHAIPNLEPRLRAKAFDVALERIRPDGNGVPFQRLKLETLIELASSAGSLPGPMLRDAVNGLLEVIPSLVSHNGRKEVLIKLAREALPRLLKQHTPIAERCLPHPIRLHLHPSREQLLRTFIEEVHELRATVRQAALQQMISDPHHSAGTGTDLIPELESLLDTTLNEILDRRTRREFQAA